MKCIYLICSLFTLILFSNCKKQEMMTYNDKRYIQFTEPQIDTLTVSFFLHPGKPELTVSMPLKMVGFLTKSDFSYQIKVDDTATNALAKNYSIPSSFSFGNSRSVDTARITIKNSPELKTKEYLLAVVIVSGSDAEAGQKAYSRKLIKINDIISRPDWWDGNVEARLLGPYTDKKFRTFIQALGMGDLTPFPPVVQSEYFRQFKYYLIRLKDAGTPVLEDDGTDMLSTVPIAG